MYVNDNSYEMIDPHIKNLSVRVGVRGFFYFYQSVRMSTLTEEVVYCEFSLRFSFANPDILNYVHFGKVKLSKHCSQKYGSK